MIRVAVLTVSDSAVNGTRDDVSGPAIIAHCQQKSWAVLAQAVVPDEGEAIASQLRSWADEEVANLILTTGGTGVAPRDVTPEATVAVLERPVQSPGKLVCHRGFAGTRHANDDKRA